jgi:ubiquinol-cytochrome c reductase iron-sulfur subunit
MSKDNTHPSEESIDLEKRTMLIQSAKVLGGIGAVCLLKPFVNALTPSELTLAEGAPLRVRIDDIPLGHYKVVEWRGKPIVIVHRTQAILTHLNNHNENLRDPLSAVPQQPFYATNEYRSIAPEWLVLVGVCTHLGCAPNFIATPNEIRDNLDGGFYCPCHGSVFDASGRVFKGVPAPINLEVPPYRFDGNAHIIIGENPDKAAL